MPHGGSRQNCPDERCYSHQLREIQKKNVPSSRDYDLGLSAQAYWIQTNLMSSCCAVEAPAPRNFRNDRNLPQKQNFVRGSWSVPAPIFFPRVALFRVLEEMCRATPQLDHLESSQDYPSSFWERFTRPRTILLIRI